MVQWEISPGQARALPVGELDSPRLAERLRMAPLSATELIDALEADR